MKNLANLVGQLHAQKIGFRSLTDSIDTATPSGQFFFHVMAPLAEMERELTIERTKAELATARKQGRTGGRPRHTTDAKIASARQLLTAGNLPRDVADSLDVSIPTLYRWAPASSMP